MTEVKKNKIKQISITVFFLIAVYLIDRYTNFPNWINFLMYLAPYLMAGGEVLKEAAKNILHGEIFDEDFLMSVATIGALCIGFFPGAEPEFTEAVLVMLLFQVGELFEEIAEGNSEKSIIELMSIRPDYANLDKNNKITKVSPETVKIDDIIVIKPGEKIPLDGIVIEGDSNINTVALTGESIPRKATRGDKVYSGCINLNGSIRVRVTKTFSESTASKMIELVKNASEKKSKSENFITQFSKVYTPVVVIGAILLATIPPIFSADYLSGLILWLQRALTFLVVSCPCALVISVPLSFFGGIGGASKKGILIKGSKDIETLSKLKTIVFDKTGTLTEGVFEVVVIHPEVYDAKKLLHFAAHVERFSNHPIAISLKRAYENEDDECQVSEVQEIAGKGIKAKVNEDVVYVGNTNLMDQLGVKWQKCDHQGTIVHAAINGKYFGHIVISDKMKEESFDTIQALKEKRNKNNFTNRRPGRDW